MVQPNRFPEETIPQLCRQVVSLSKFIAIGTLITFGASAHEMTPAYPEVKVSHVKNVVKVEMSLFNSREEIKYYQIDLFDLNWMPIPFSTPYRIMKVDYKEHKAFDVYIRKRDTPEAVYLCTTSKVKKTNKSRTLGSSRICSRLDGPPA